MLIYERFLNKIWKIILKPPPTWSWNLVGNVLLVDNYIDNGASCLKPIDVKVDTEDRLSELSKDVELTNKVRLKFYETYFISEKETENNVVWNFFKWIIDALLEFPWVVELYYNNEDFRKKLHEAIKNLEVNDYINVFWEIGDNLIEWRAYLKWKATAQVVMLATGMQWAIKTVTKKVVQASSELSIKPVAASMVVTWLHTTWYAMSTKQEKWYHNKIKGI